MRTFLTYNNEVGALRQLQLEYWPRRGRPDSPISLNSVSLSATSYLFINNTWPAVGYTVQLMALRANGKRETLQSCIIYSSIIIKKIK